MVTSEYTRPDQSAYHSSPPLWYVFQLCAHALCASIDRLTLSLPSSLSQSPPKVSPKAQVLPKKRIELPAIEQGRPETQPVSSMVLSNTVALYQPFSPTLQSEVQEEIDVED